MNIFGIIENNRYNVDVPTDNSMSYHAVGVRQALNSFVTKICLNSNILPISLKKQLYSSQLTVISWILLVTMVYFKTV